MRAQRAQHVHLPRRVVQVIVAADHVRDAHVHVVDDDAEVIGGRAVRAGDDEIVELGVLERDGAVHEIFDHDRAVQRILEAHHRLHAGTRLGAIAADAGIARLFLARGLLRAHLLQLLLGAVAVIRGAGREHLRDHFAIAIEALRLVVRAFVRVEPQPLHALEDDAHGLVGGALAVRVLDTQNELAAVAARIQPAEKRRAHATDVQQAGGARGEAGYYRHRGADGSIRALSNGRLAQR